MKTTRVATAIAGDPREPVARADIFAIDGSEYLVPDESRYEGNKLVESIIRLDQAKRIIHRPQDSRQIKDMELSADIPPDVRPLLAKAVEAVNPTTYGYSVRIRRMENEIDKQIEYKRHLTARDIAELPDKFYRAEESA